MARPTALPKGTVYYYDESMPTVPWMAGLREVRAWEKYSGKSMDQLGSTDDMLYLAYMSLRRDAHLPAGASDSGQVCVSFEEWAEGVMWLFDDTPQSPGEASASTV